LLLSWMRWKFHLIHDSSKQQYWWTYLKLYVSYVFLMMGGGTA